MLSLSSSHALSFSLSLIPSSGPLRPDQPSASVAGSQLLPPQSPLLGAQAGEDGVYQASREIQGNTVGSGVRF